MYICEIFASKPCSYCNFNNLLVQTALGIYNKLSYMPISTNVPLLHIKTWSPEFLYTNLMCVIAYAVK
jgi:hypothetical protein